MKQKLTSSLMLLVLMMNVFFDLTLSHHSNSFSSEEYSETSIIPSHQNNDSHQSDMGSCASGACHTGYCKLLNLNSINYKIAPVIQAEYGVTAQSIPSSPYLMGNRRPPKYA